ncbi:nickel/cobalt transporter [Streptomyces sp. NPDC059819]|uniref:nickel/cobalt transporter n=1 Tax=Streptomyces sp. NPDC059819 TaxID=3346963 RepID=UPI00365C592F
MNTILRRAAIAAFGAALASAVVLPAANAAAMHPLGNFTVNYHTGLTLRADGAEAKVIVDRAEISTLQERPRIDLNHDGDTSPAEIGIYSKAACATLGEQLHVDVDKRPLVWRPAAQGLTFEPGQAGLKTSRLTCTYTAAADLNEAADIRVLTSYNTQRIGWREMTVRGDGLRITGTELPATSPTDELRHYPPDPTASPLNQHTAQLHTQPGTPAQAGARVAGLPATGWASGILAALTARFDSLLGARELTLPVGLLAVLLALVLGASHAVLPGHGKTIMAAYLAGRRGTKRDAVTVGATVTATHTAGVLVLGLALPTATHLAGESVLTWLGATSGLIVTGIGLWLLIPALRGRPSHGHHHHDGHGHHHHEGGHTQRHHDGHSHGNDGHDHSHPRRSLKALLPQRRHADEVQRDRSGAVSTLVKPASALSTGTLSVDTAHHHEHHHSAGRGGLIGMGIAGGLVPSPSALVVLLGAIALGRTAFGVLLVIAYGLGMAATLTVAGLLLVRLRDHLETRTHTLTPTSRRALRKLARTGPVMTSLLVVVVGLGLTLMAVTSST